MILGWVLRRYTQEGNRQWLGQVSVFTVTYIAYAVATAARLPYSLAKTSLRPTDPSASVPGWSPFNQDGGQELLGMLDTIFMAGYAFAMPVMGSIADRVNQVVFLTFGLVMISVMLVLLGMAHSWDIHNYGYFAATTLLGGCAQSICYPCVIAIISKWFGKSNIGLLLGIWSSCTPFGTIFGKLAGTAALAKGWQMTYISSGIFTACAAVLVLALLVGDPHDVKLLRPSDVQEAQEAETERNVDEDEPVPLRVLLQIPGMIAYCVACFFSKLAYYAFLFWLPLYLNQSLGYDKTAAGNISTFFDWGGFVGGIVGGVLMDRLKLRGPVLLVFQTCAPAMLLAYMLICRVAVVSDVWQAVLLFFLGFTVTTPYSLITSVMATDLGRDPSLEGNSKAAATVTGILDGTGSFGAVVQGLAMGWISNTFGWNSALIMLMIFSLFSAFCLIRPSVKELRARITEETPLARSLSLAVQA